MLKKDIFTMRNHDYRKMFCVTCSCKLGIYGSLYNLEWLEGFCRLKFCWLCLSYFSPINLTESTPWQVVFASVNCSLSEHLRLYDVSFSLKICFMKVGFRLSLLLYVSHKQLQVAQMNGYRVINVQ